MNSFPYPIIVREGFICFGSRVGGYLMGAQVKVGINDRVSCHHDYLGSIAVKLIV